MIKFSLHFFFWPRSGLSPVTRYGCHLNLIINCFFHSFVFNILSSTCESAHTILSAVSPNFIIITYKCVTEFALVLYFDEMCMFFSVMLLDL